MMKIGLLICVLISSLWSGTLAAIVFAPIPKPDPEIKVGFVFWRGLYPLQVYRIENNKYYLRMARWPGMAWHDDPVTEESIRDDLKKYYQPDRNRYLPLAKSFDEALDDPAGNFKKEIIEGNLKLQRERP